MLAEGSSTICRYSDCADALALLGVFDTLGVDYRQEGDTLRVQGRSWRVAESRVECGESAFLARTLPVLLPGMGISAVVGGQGTLVQRSQADLLAVLKVLGIPCQNEGDYLPVAVSTANLGTRVVLPPQSTSQVASGVLMAMGTIPERVEVDNLPTSSGGYLQLTLQIMQHFGVTWREAKPGKLSKPAGGLYHAAEFCCEADWSAAALLIAGAAIGGELILYGLNPESLQPDKAILEVCRGVGVECVFNGEALWVRGVENAKELRPFDYDIGGCPDLAPALAVLASLIPEESCIRGIARLANKESNRALVLSEMLRNFGVDATLGSEILRIQGGFARISNPPVIVNVHADHRMAMAGYLLGLFYPGEGLLSDPTCVAKSYPRFFDDVGALLAKGR
jgi:3-phosphoshikimate 1-carboxyvinyltransferase